MIYKDSKGKSAIITRLKDKVAVYWGLVLKWAQARSCYGTGACSTPGLSVPHHLLEIAQVHVH